MNNKFKAKKVGSKGDVLLMCCMTEQGLEVHLPKHGGDAREYSRLLASVVQGVAAKFQTDIDAVIAGILLSKQDVENNSHICRVELDQADGRGRFYSPRGLMEREMIVKEATDEQRLWLD